MFNGRCQSLGTILARKTIVGIVIRTTTCARQPHSVSLTATLLRTERRASQRLEGCTVWNVTVRTNAKMQTSFNSTWVSVIWTHKCKDHHMDLDSKHSCETFGNNLPSIVEADSSSAESYARRRGLGKQRNVKTRYLWIQDMIASNSFVIRKLPTTSTVSDILAKAIDRKTLDKDFSTMRFVEVPASKMHKKQSWAGASRPERRSKCLTEDHDGCVTRTRLTDTIKIRDQNTSTDASWNIHSSGCRKWQRAKHVAGCTIRARLDKIPQKSK